jgi:predicted dienelactone hydrolase
MNFKVGQKVRIKRDLIVGHSYGGWNICSEMEKYIGKIATITLIRECRRKNEYLIDLDDGEWTWTKEMLDIIPIRILKVTL